jgi:hypothetical protein
MQQHQRFLQQHPLSRVVSVEEAERASQARSVEGQCFVTL